MKTETKLIGVRVLFILSIVAMGVLVSRITKKEKTLIFG